MDNTPPSYSKFSGWEDFKYTALGLGMLLSPVILLLCAALIFFSLFG